MGALQVRHEPASAAVVRRHIREDLDRQGVASDSTDMVLLVATELVGNAVRHSAPARDGMLNVQWDLDGDCFTVQVSDSSAQLPQRRRPSVDQPDGRGLGIIEAVAEAWGASAVADGKQVWARVLIERADARSAQMA